MPVRKSAVKKSNAKEQKRSVHSSCVNRAGRPVNQARHDAGLKACAAREKKQVSRYEDMNRRFECAAHDADAAALAKRQASDAGAEVTTASVAADRALQDKAAATSRYELIHAEVQRMLLEAEMDVEEKSVFSDQALASLQCKEAVLAEAQRNETAMTQNFLQQLQLLPSEVPAMFRENLVERAQLSDNALSWSQGGM